MTFTVSGFLDLIGGGAAFILVIVMLTRGFFRSPRSSSTFIKYLRPLAILCVLGIVGDLIGGLYAIGAQIGLYSCIIDWITVRD